MEPCCASEVAKGRTPLQCGPQATAREHAICDEPAGKERQPLHPSRTRSPPPGDKITGPGGSGSAMLLS
jgi:hypothetical protein